LEAKALNFGSNLCPKSWKDFLPDWKRLESYNAQNFGNKNLGLLRKIPKIREIRQGKVRARRKINFGKSL